MHVALVISVSNVPISKFIYSNRVITNKLVYFSSANQQLIQIGILFFGISHKQYNPYLHTKNLVCQIYPACQY